MNRINMSLECVAAVDLPGNPGPLHTILVDGQDTLYYSDEINHAVVSMNREGTVRWIRGVDSPQSVRCRYPRGMSLGRIERAGDLERCLAVADSWHGRVLFLDLNGDYLQAWDRAGDTPFGEVADVRYIAPAGAAPSEDAGCGYWLILDRGNHRLCALGLDGRTLFQIGRGFPLPSDHWPSPGPRHRFHPAEPGIIEEFPLFDFLYYPTRILGDSEDAMFVWEPFGRRLKFVCLGCLFPVDAGSAEDEDWVAADKSGILGWSRKDGWLRAYDHGGRLLLSEKIEGTPVASNLPANQCWVQDGSRIRRLAASPENQESVPMPVASSALVRTAQAQLSQFNSEPASAAVRDLAQAMDAVAALAKKVLQAGQARATIAANVQAMWTRAAELEQEIPRLQPVVEHALIPLTLAILEVQIAQALSAGDTEPLLLKAADSCATLLAPLRDRYAALVERMDDLNLLCGKLSRLSILEQGSIADERSLAEHMQAQIHPIVNWIIDWCGPAQEPAKSVAIESGAGANREGEARCRPMGAGLRMPAPRPLYRSTRLLREIDRIPLPGFEAPPSMGPWGLAANGTGVLVVSLFKAQSVLVLDAAGKHLATLGKSGGGPGEFDCPTGLAVDKQDRLWICDANNHRIQLYAPPYAPSSLIAPPPSWDRQFLWPSGICALPDGSMLVADPGGNTITRLSIEGGAEAICDREGQAPGEVRHPVSFSISSQDPQDRVWVVDKRNHRLQQLDLAGRCLREIGGCSLRPGNLLWPISAAFFADGTLIVAQEPRNACLVLFTTGGEELGRVILDYCPAGILIQDERLLVNQFDGGCIRVYQRT